MGWGTGTELFLKVWQAMKPRLRFGESEIAAGELIELFEQYDCDTISDVIDDDEELLAAYRQLHPEERQQ